MVDAQREWIAAWRCVTLGEAQELMLVLAALGIDYWLAPEDSQYVLRTSPREAGEARRQLQEYVAERAVWPPAEKPLPVLRPELRDVGGYWLVLIGIFLCQQRQALGVDWLVAGRAQASLLSRGEWWRAATALTLHANGPHLFNNLVFGTLFAFLLSRELGRGLTWFAVLVAGMAANGVNTWGQPPDHTSVGASTAVFAAIGMTVVLQWRHHATRELLLRRWAPVIIGLIFLGFLGTTGERTDVLAHVWGLLAGLGLGGVLHHLRTRLAFAAAPRGWLEALAVLLLALAWALALSQAH